MQRRHFHFLQGNASHFYRRLGQRLADDGHMVSHVNLCGGDRLFWGDWNAVDYRGPAAGFGTFLDDLFRRTGVTDIVLFGDCRSPHRVAIDIARRAGIAAHVFEEGYMRPGWITLERDGVNGYSRLPGDPAWYHERATADPVRPWTGEYGMRNRVLYDFQWQVANYLRLARYPRYRTHRPYPIWAEYATWAARLAALPRRKAEAQRVVAELLASARPFFVFPLQLDTDSQIRVHSPFRRLLPAIEAVIADFARSAPTDARLVIKNHPLDNGWIAYGRHARAQARRLGVDDRLAFIDGGDLGALIGRARGVVTVNSTVGLTALQRAAPVITLGRAIYDVAGLTHQGSLASFWSDPSLPDADLLRDFVAVLAACAMVPGGFYTEDAVAHGVDAAARRMAGDDQLLAGFQPGHRAFAPRVANRDNLDAAA